MNEHAQKRFDATMQCIHLLRQYCELMPHLRFQQALCALHLLEGFYKEPWETAEHIQNAIDEIIANRSASTPK